jgi:hypothetical protein
MSRITLLLFVSFMVILNFSIHAQVTIAEFLRSAEVDPEVKTFNDQLSYLQKKPYRLSPLQKLEFRTQNRELITTQQEYAIRINPANPWEMKSNNRYFREYESSLSLEKEMLYKQILADRYNLIIEYLIATELRSLTEERQKLIASQLSVLEKQFGSSYFDADDYVDLKIDHLSESVALEENDVDVSEYIYQVERLYPNTYKKKLEWDFGSAITVEKIESVIDSIVQSSARSVLLAYQQQKIALAQSEYKLEKSNISLGFFQTSVDNRRIEQGRNPVNISFGITIPVSNPNKGDMAKRKLEIIEAHYDLEESKQEEQADKIMLYDKIARLIAQYKNLQTKLAELQNGNLAKTLATLKNEDPLVMVQFKQNLIKLRVLSVKLKRSIMLTYIEYLNSIDKLQAQPMLNYLSTNLEEIGN